VVGGQIFNTLESEFVQFAAKEQLPTIYHFPHFATSGGLMAYGPDNIDSYRRAATFVDRILKGTNPAEIPIERPSKFDLVVNATTAQTLGLTIPQDVAAQVTDWAQ
jgi:putative ABC transport system substrate-binding protein